MCFEVKGILNSYNKMNGIFIKIKLRCENYINKNVLVGNLEFMIVEDC